MPERIDNIAQSRHHPSRFDKEDILVLILNFNLILQYLDSISNDVHNETTSELYIKYFLLVNSFISLALTVLWGGYRSRWRHVNDAVFLGYKVEFKKKGCPQQINIFMIKRSFV